MASSAIPIFFPAIRIGERYYADGCLRSVTPLSPAIHLGADRIVAIGIRSPGAEEEHVESQEGVDAYPSIAETAGLFLNAIFVEGLEADIERLDRINRTLDLIPHSAIGATQLRKVPLYVLRPSCDLGSLAEETLTHLPLLLEHLFRGLGVSGKSGGDLLSYLAFECSYTSKLLMLGYRDAMADAESLVDFIAPKSEEMPRSTHA